MEPGSERALHCEAFYLPFELSPTPSPPPLGGLSNHPPVTPLDLTPGNRKTPVFSFHVQHFLKKKNYVNKTTHILGVTFKIYPSSPPKVLSTLSQGAVPGCTHPSPVPMATAQYLSSPAGTVLLACWEAFTGFPFS